MSRERELLREAIPCLESPFRIVRMGDGLRMGDGYPSAVERDNSELVRRIRALLAEPEPEPEWVWRVSIEFDDKPRKVVSQDEDDVRREAYYWRTFESKVERAQIGPWEVVE